MTIQSEIAHLRACGFRVIAPFDPERARTFDFPPSDDLRSAVVIDTETTGLDPRADEIVQLGMVRVGYDAHTGAVHSIGEPWSALDCPQGSISAEATAVHGWTKEKLRGHYITTADVRARLLGVSLLIAHNAAFDAPFFARRFPELVKEPLPWACSLADVPWKSCGYESARLGALLQDHTQHHFAAHDAGTDAAAVAHILATPFAYGTVPFAVMLANARARKVRVYAEGAPFDHRDVLKERGYRWDAARRVWWTEILAEHEAAERTWLAAPTIPRVIAVDPTTRFL
jgi:DNA polymerase-3 subunit epsilon